MGGRREPRRAEPSAPGEPTHPLVNVVVLQLNKAGADGSDVALLVGEGHASGALRVLELWICVDAGVADAAVQPIHNHGQLHCGGKEQKEKKKR